MKAQVLPLTLLCCAFSTLLYAQNTVQQDSYFKNSIIYATSTARDQAMMHQVAQAAQLTEMLDNEGPFTVFAPSDGAFEALPDAMFRRWMQPENKSKLTALVSYHIIAGEFTAARILKEMCRGEGSATFTTVNGDPIRATMEGTDIVLTDMHGNKARIIKADTNQCNGVVHKIDSVIRPGRL